MDGIPARTPQPIENIGPMVNQFELQRWMARVEARAQEDNLLPESWPLREGEVVFQEEPTQEFPEDQPGLPPTGPVSLTFSNGALEEDTVRAAVIFSINKEAAIKNAFPNEETQLFVNLAEGKAEINDNSYNPERSIALLEEAGYLGEFTFVYVLVPLDDSNLFAFAQILRESLLAIEIETELVIYSTFDPEYVEGFQETGRPMISILRDN
jgi:ABC-type transport system substrate-binding protein